MEHSTARKLLSSHPIRHDPMTLSGTDHGEWCVVFTRPLESGVSSRSAPCISGHPSEFSEQDFFIPFSLHSGVQVVVYQLYARVT